MQFENQSCSLIAFLLLFQQVLKGDFQSFCGFLSFRSCFTNCLFIWRIWA